MRKFSSLLKKQYMMTTGAELPQLHRVSIADIDIRFESSCTAILVAMLWTDSKKGQVKNLKLELI